MEVDAGGVSADERDASGSRVPDGARSKMNSSSSSLRGILRVAGEEVERSPQVINDCMRRVVVVVVVIAIPRLEWQASHVKSDTCAGIDRRTARGATIQLHLGVLCSFRGEILQG